jgi:NNP family nitrate/nitrite transporter-like MFS transporter
MEAPAAFAADGDAKAAPGVVSEATFDLPVDSEHKATELRITSIALPHMRAFHMAWLMFFTAFLSTFAPAALGPIIRQDLDLTKGDLGDAGSAAVTGTIFCRLVMGTFCDTFGPRYGFAFLMVLTAPAVFSMSVATDAIGYIMCRFFIGFSLATFVSCQFWCSVMFNGKIVGLANATAGGWGNLGGGVTQFLIPAIYTGIKASVPAFEAWRWTFFVPGAAHVVLGLGCLFLAQDLPDGQYAFLKKTGQMESVSAWKVTMLGVMNYRMWVLTFCYGFCFGVELTMNNIVVNYFFDYFDMDIVTAGICGSMFGMMNLFARSVGGQLSDYFARKYGMRGRLWVLWVTQTMNGVMCVILGRVSTSLGATMFVMIAFSSFVQAAEGATFGVVPFVSRRALGVVSGFVGAGGNTGAALMMNAFFKGEKGWGNYDTHDGMSYMGLVVICVTLLVCFIHFPMWGSMFLPASSEEATEEDYYLSDYTEEEIAAGLAKGAQLFAANARQERGAIRYQQYVDGAPKL